MPFPRGFTWGAGAAAYQIEGAANEDGRGPSVWDDFCERPGVIRGGESGAVACDHYHRYVEDVALMKEIGLGAYRLSISWPRVLPHGVGEINEKGLAFYDRLVDELLGAGIEPWVTLFHWDFPSALYRRGGWLERDSAEWFADYTWTVVNRLSDRVKHWITINEPQVFLAAGHAEGWHAPGDKLPMKGQLLAAHHVLLAHGRAVEVIREHAKTEPVIGWAPQCTAKYPSSDSPEDHAAAREAFLAVNGDTLWTFAWFADAVHRGAYPEWGVKAFGDAAPVPADGDMEIISQPVDFCGLNIYSGDEVRAGKGGKNETVPPPPGAARTAFDWLIAPESLCWGPKLVWERYRVPIVITENGMSGNDTSHMDGRVNDPLRIDFTRRYLLELERAIEDGVRTLGYFHWSIFDNFEWAEGYRHRFGLVYVDFETQRRVLKESARWYREVIRSNGASLAPAEAERSAWHA